MVKNIKWQKLRDKVFVKHLARDEKRDFQIDLLKLEANTTYSEHGHPDVEWVYVIKGSFQDESGVYKSGEFKVNPKFSKHSIKTRDDGCELLVCWCGRLT